MILLLAWILVRTGFCDVTLVSNIDFTDMTLVIGDSDDARGGATVRRCKSKGFSYQQSDWLSSFSLLFSLRETPHFQHTTENVIKSNDSCMLRLGEQSLLLCCLIFREVVAPEFLITFFETYCWSLINRLFQNFSRLHLRWNSVQEQRRKANYM